MREEHYSYREVIAQFLEISGAAAAIIGVNLKFPFNWIVGASGVAVGIIGLVLDIFAVGFNKAKVKVKVSKEQIKQQFLQEVIDYAYSMKLFPLIDTFDDRTLKLVHQNNLKKKTYDVVNPLDIPDVDKINATYMSVLEEVKEKINDFIRNNPDAQLEEPVDGQN